MTVRAVGLECRLRKLSSMAELLAASGAACTHNPAFPDKAGEPHRDVPVAVAAGANTGANRKPWPKYAIDCSGRCNVKGVGGAGVLLVDAQLDSLSLQQALQLVYSRQGHSMQSSCRDSMPVYLQVAALAHRTATAEGEWLSMFTLITAAVPTACPH